MLTDAEGHYYGKLGTGKKKEKKKPEGGFPVVPIAPIKRHKPKPKGIEGRRVVKGRVVREGGKRKALESAAQRRAIGSSTSKAGTVARRTGSTVARRGGSDVVGRGLSATKKGGMRMGPYGWIIAGAAIAAEAGNELQKKKNAKGEYITGKKGGSYTGTSPQWKKRKGAGLTGPWGQYDKSNAAPKHTTRLSDADVTKRKGNNNSKQDQINRKAAIADRVRLGRYKGKYYGRDVFRGDIEKIYAWKRAGKPKDVGRFNADYSRMKRSQG